MDLYVDLYLCIFEWGLYLYLHILMCVYDHVGLTYVSLCVFYLFACVGLHVNFFVICVCVFCVCIICGFS